MKYDFSGFKKKGDETAEHLRKELSGLHTGRATSAILDSIFIESYGAQLAIQHVATIANEDARTLRIIPWEKGNAKEIEKAINNADLGVSVSTDDEGLRIFFPPLTTERRVAFTKIVGDKVEDARVALKSAREQTKNDIIALERDGGLSEDEKKFALDELQKIVDETNKNFEAIGDKKEKEIMGE